MSKDITGTKELHDCLICHGVHSFGQVADILGRNASHGDTAVLISEEDTIVFGDGRHLLLGHENLFPLITSLLPCAITPL